MRLDEGRTQRRCERDVHATPGKSITSVTQNPDWRLLYNYVKMVHCDFIGYAPLLQTTLKKSSFKERKKYEEPYIMLGSVTVGEFRQMSHFTCARACRTMFPATYKSTFSTNMPKLLSSRSSNTSTSLSSLKSL